MRVSYCSKAKQKRMIAKGWRLMIAKWLESPEELFERLIKEGFSKIKICYTSTIGRGNQYFAMVKR